MNRGRAEMIETESMWREKLKGKWTEETINGQTNG